MKDLELGGLLPGIKINTQQPTLPRFRQVQLSKFKGETWERFGEVISGDVGG